MERLHEIHRRIFKLFNYHNTIYSIGVDSDSFLCGISGLFITVTTNHWQPRTRRHETHHSGVTERGTEGSLGEWEPESRLVRPEVPSEDIPLVLKDTKAAG